eukprot:scaffold602_cov298-Pinguiococcus_pyrenoidosus.AAC.53
MTCYPSTGITFPLGWDRSALFDRSFATWRQSRIRSATSSVVASLLKLVQPLSGVIPSEDGPGWEAAALSGQDASFPGEAAAADHRAGQRGRRGGRSAFCRRSEGRRLGF